MPSAHIAATTRKGRDGHPLGNRIAYEKDYHKQPLYSKRPHTERDDTMTKTKTMTTCEGTAAEVEFADVSDYAALHMTEDLEISESLYEFIRSRTTARKRPNAMPDGPTKNLLLEIVEKLGESGMTVADIACVTNRDGSDNIDVASFLDMARYFEYDPGYGSEKIPADLVIMMLDGTWLERMVDDGAEWFEHKRPPKVKPRPRIVTGWNQMPYAAGNGTAAFFMG